VHPHPIEFPVGLEDGCARSNPQTPFPRVPVGFVLGGACLPKKGEKIRAENEVGVSLKQELFGAGEN
jgi:hypothetical protein